MNRTKQAWKVVSDPYAPESSWVPACEETQSPDPSISLSVLAPATKSTRRKILEVVALSGVTAALGGAFAAQAVHVNYYAQHLVGQVLYNDPGFEQWGSFYYWFNQASGALAYVPVFFSYSMGFLSHTFNLSKPVVLLNFGMLAIYYGLVAYFFNYAPYAYDPGSYFFVLGASGVIGTIFAYYLGKKIARNLSNLLNPQSIFFALFWALMPAAAMYIAATQTLGNYSFVLALCLMIPVLVGVMTRTMTRATSLKTTVMLSLSAASPLLLCGLMHVPVAGWFGFNWSVSFNAGLTRDLFYYLGLPVAAVVLPIAGAVFANALDKRKRDDEEALPFAPSAEEIYPLPKAHTIEL